jgi:hypothetical protein
MYCLYSYLLEVRSRTCIKFFVDLLGVRSRTCRHCLFINNSACTEVINLKNCMQTSYAMDDRVLYFRRFALLIFTLAVTLKRGNLSPLQAPGVVVFAILNNRLDQAEFRLMTCVACIFIHYFHARSNGGFGKHKIMLVNMYKSRLQFYVYMEPIS